MHLIYNTNKKTEREKIYPSRSSVGDDSHHISQSGGGLDETSLAERHGRLPFLVLELRGVMEAVSALSDAM